MKALAPGLALLLAACAGQPVTTRVEIQRVEVPVPVKPTPSAELMTCPLRWPSITFYKPDDKRYVAALDQQGMRALADFGNHATACILGWRAWATP